MTSTSNQHPNNGDHVHQCTGKKQRFIHNSARNTGDIWSIVFVLMILFQSQNSPFPFLEMGIILSTLVKLWYHILRNIENCPEVKSHNNWTKFSGENCVWTKLWTIFHMTFTSTQRLQRQIMDCNVEIASEPHHFVDKCIFYDCVVKNNRERVTSMIL